MVHYKNHWLILVSTAINFESHKRQKISGLVVSLLASQEQL